MGGPTNDLWRRIWLTLGVLAVYRLGTHLAIPGLDPSVLAGILWQQKTGILFVYDYYFPPTDGMSLFALGILPYISAAIILQLMTVVSSRLAALKHEGEAGRRELNRYACYGAILLAVVQSYGIAVDLEAQGLGLVIEPGPWFRGGAVLTMTGGVMLLIWLADQIDRRGIGPGAFLILASAIAADLPTVGTGIFELLRIGLLGWGFGLVLLPIVVISAVAASVALAYARRPLFLQGAERKIEVPLFPLCILGLGPVVLTAILFMPLPGAVSFSLWPVPLIDLGPPVNSVAAFVLILGLIILLAPVAAKSASLAVAQREDGASVPDVQPGEVAAARLEGVVRRLAALAGLLMALVIVLPEVILLRGNAPWASSGVSLLILTFVMLAVVRQIRGEFLDPSKELRAHGTGSAVG